MSKFQKLAQINKIANECAQDGDFVLASKFHNEFMKIAQNQRTYKVTDFRETLLDIAGKTGVSVMQIKGYNPKIQDVVMQGTIVNLGPVLRKDMPGTHTVGTGETATSIARIYKISVNDLQKMNPGKDLNKLFSGEKLKVPFKKSSLESESDMMAEEMPGMPGM